MIILSCRHSKPALAVLGREVYRGSVGGGKGLVRVVVALFAVSALTGAALASPRGSSDNWAGYAAYGTPFRSVSGSWVQPSAQCFGRPLSSTEAAFWVGLGGNAASSTKVEQIGTEADCDPNGKPDYYAWYELWPADGHVLELDVLPGDLIRARVTLGPNNVRVSIDDVTGGQRFSKT